MPVERLSSQDLYFISFWNAIVHHLQRSSPFPPTISASSWREDPVIQMIAGGNTKTATRNLKTVIDIAVRLGAARPSVKRGVYNVIGDIQVAGPVE